MDVWQEACPAQFLHLQTRQWPSDGSCCQAQGGGRGGGAEPTCWSPVGRAYLPWHPVNRLTKMPRCPLPWGGILSFLSHSVVWIMPILSMGPSAKANVCIVLKTYILSLWEPEWTDTFLPPFQGGDWVGGGVGKVGFLFVFFHFSSIALTQDTMWMALASHSSKYMNL